MSSCWGNTLHPHKWLWQCEGGTEVEGNPTLEFPSVKMKHFWGNEGSCSQTCGVEQRCEPLRASVPVLGDCPSASL